MKAFLKKHRFKFVIGILIFILIYVSFYMLWVHVPYATKQNELTRIQNVICEKNGYQFDDYFHEYNSRETYYILRVKKEKKTLYVAYDEDLKLITEFDGQIVKKGDIQAAFKEKYKKDATKIEIGYENSTLVYAVTYKNQNSLLYAYYDLSSGEFIKAYRL